MISSSNVKNTMKLLTKQVLIFGSLTTGVSNVYSLEVGLDVFTEANLSFYGVSNPADFAEETRVYAKEQQFDVISIWSPILWPDLTNKTGGVLIIIGVRVKFFE